MDIGYYLRRFEESFSLYTGDDPLDPWDKFVDYLEQRTPEGHGRDLSQVFDSLVQRFSNMEKYSEDTRYVKHCIKCARFHPDPVALYTRLYSKGVGHRSAALHLAWAQQLELRGMLEQAEAVYQRAVTNHAQPADAILNQYRNFQTRTKRQTSVSESGNPAENSQASAECSAKPPAYVITVSRSETSGTSRSSGVPFVSEYLKEELLCEGSELCFEEVRAAKYFRQEANRAQAGLNQAVEAEAVEQPCAPVPTSVLAPTQQVLPQEPQVSQEEERRPEPGDGLNMSQGETGNLSHVTPNTSLGLVQATPSRVLPSPTVNTREALDVIMDMFQAPTLLGEPFSATAAFPAPELEVEAEPAGGASASLARPPASAAAFTIFQDDQDGEHSRVAAPHPPIGAPAQGPLAHRPDDTPPEPSPDKSTSWGARYDSLRSLAACPNSTTDFAMLVQFVSTPSVSKTPHSSGFLQDEENSGGGAEDDAFTRRQAKKLSPIMEQSPADEAAVSQLAPPPHGLGTTVGEALGSSSSTSVVQPPLPGVLSFRDQTGCSRTTLNAEPASPSAAQREAFRIPEDPVWDVSMSPESALRPDWMNIRSPEAPPETDLDAFLSPCRPRTADVPMSPEPASPAPAPPMDTTASPDRGGAWDASMSAATPTLGCGGSLVLVSNPWDEELISWRLSKLTPPLSSHPRYTAWAFGTPVISPRTTITMGAASLRVDCVLGRGAFATVYQATDPATSEKMVLKVQKPANPWEFYIHTQLDARLQPATRHLYANVRSAHVFADGSVLLADLHKYGTLLNAVNIYKSLSEKVMPPPLVLYFATCILRMVEQLHAIGIIHADVKPDNFLLGERFLENQCFEPENLDHGLVLVDLGQSLDMALFPGSTAFTAKCLTSGFQCAEMLSGRPWNYQTDYFGLAGTVYCMLFGSYMQVTNDGGVWRTNGVFRRVPHSELWQEFFHALLNVPSCSSPPILPRLRETLTAALQQNYSGSKLRTLKSRLLVQLLERRKAAAK